MKTSALICVICGQMLFLSACKPAHAPPAQSPPAPQRITWEYKVVTITNSAITLEEDERHKAGSSNPDHEQINFLRGYAGTFTIEPDLLPADGWELVAAVPQIETALPAGLGGFAIGNTRTSRIFLLFKRPAEK